MRRRFLAIGILLACALAMPGYYEWVAFHAPDGILFTPKILAHVLLNCAANAIVGIAALRLNGRFDQRLSQVFARTLLVHGALAFVTLVTRIYYSIPMTLFGVLASVFIGVVAMRLRQPSSLPRVGIIGPPAPDLAAYGLRGELITEPDAPLQGYDLLLLTFKGQTPVEWTETVSRALFAGKRVRHVTDLIEETQGLVAIDHFDLDHLRRGGLTGYGSGKRVFDYVVVILSLPVTAPLTVLAALAVILFDGTPAFFIQPRTGFGGKVFKLVKLRTMHPQAMAPAGFTTAKQDTRVTGIGRWLRRFHIDELPQIWNVLIGDMSLVGPRPEQHVLAETYAAEVPTYVYRQLLRPGITGWAQVRTGYAGDLQETRVKLGFDLFYLKNISFALDLQILLRTVWTILSGKGVR